MKLQPRLTKSPTRLLRAIALFRAIALYSIVTFTHLIFIETSADASPKATAKALASADAEAKAWQPHLTSYGFDTSDELHFQSLVVSYENYRSDLFWPYSTEGDSGQGYDFQYEQINIQNTVATLAANSVSAAWINKVSPKANFKYQVGYLNWQTEDQPSRSDAIFEFNHQYEWSPTLLSEFNLKRGYLFHQVLPIDSVFENIEASSFSPRLVWQTSKNWRITYRGSYSELEDKNSRAESDGQALYKISSNPWLWLGPGVSYLSFRDKRQTAYYSPRYVRAVGPRLDFSERITKEISFSLGGSYNWTVDEGVASRGHYLLASLNYGTREGAKFILSFEQIQSERQNTMWKSSGFNFGFQF